MLIEVKGNVGPRTLGTVSFDGRVLEFFSFGTAESQRIHINQIITVKGGRKGDQLILAVEYDHGIRNTNVDPEFEEELKTMVNVIRDNID